MKSVLISVQPKWCAKIANGEKTVEVRKTRPKLETPFKVYIYCTKDNRKYALHTYINSGYGRKEFGAIGHWRSGEDVVDVNSHLLAYRYNAYLAEGKVIGEFVCDEIIAAKRGNYCNIPLKDVCLDAYELMDYADDKPVYGWHISDLVIYDKPRELSEFITPTDCASKIAKDMLCNTCCLSANFCSKKPKRISRPPQSWCYVEEVQA